MRGQNITSYLVRGGRVGLAGAAGVARRAGEDWDRERGASAVRAFQLEAW